MGEGDGVVMTQRLTGKRAIVTGAGAGIGRGVAIKLAEEGASVGVLDVNLKTAEESAAAIRDAGGNAVALQVDVRNEQQVADAVAHLESRFGGLDTIIANAAELDLETWEQCMAVNVTGMFLTCKHGLRALERNQGGAVVITASPTGTLGCAPTFTAYSTSKAGTLGLMRILAIDYVKKNIRVNAVLPGTTNSPLVATLMQDPAMRAEFLAKIPMGRAADASEIANVIAFLASDEASYVTGAAWFADGGLSSI
jgi:NAD(P)-dependent dehydrogenase (short-subunit alcohol dehydrogenase family)